MLRSSERSPDTGAADGRHGAPAISAALISTAVPAGAPPLPEASINRMPRFGVAIFDNPNDMSAGWACSCDGDSFHFGALAELTNDVIWVTSAAWEVYQQVGRQTHNLRRVDYLKTNLLRIATDLGIRTEGHYACAAAFALARVAQQTASIAASVYRWTDPGRELTSDVLSDDIRRALPQPPRSKPHIASALSQAYQPNSAPQWPRYYEEGCIALTLRMNRLQYTQSLLDESVPDEGWNVEMRGEVLRRCNWKLDAYMDPERPALVEATVELSGAQPELATLAAFGSQSGRRSAHRRWLSQPELRWLSTFANIQVTAAIVSVHRRSLPDAVKLPVDLVKDPLLAMSISAGLVAESHFQALTAERRQPGQAADKKVVSTWAVWLRAYDRARMFALAQAAFAAGFTPLNYGGGALTVKLPKSRLPDLLLFAEQNGIAHPALHPYFVEHGLAHAGRPLVVPG